MEIEQSYCDKHGKEITEFALLKFFHFKGVNRQGRGRKNYYIYKWVRLYEFNGKMYWVALHLLDSRGDYFHLRTVAGKDRVVDCEIIQDTNY